MENRKEIPPITICPWPKLAIPKTEIQNILTFLAYRTNKPVTFRWYTDDEGYSENSISVRVAVSDGIRKTSKIKAIRLGDKEYVLAENQVTIDIDIDTPMEKQILDSNSHTLAYVDHNRIIIPIELTATDSDEARVLLAYIVEHSIGLLDFKMGNKLLQHRRRLANRFCEVFAKTVENRIEEQQQNLEDSERKAEQAHYTIIEFEQKRPVIQKELKFLKKLKQIKRPRLFRKQAHSLIELLSTGQYGSIEANDDGSISATTAPITIEYNDWKFPMGRYVININSANSITIEALDEHPDTDYPHPHVATDGRPCLGNIAADIPKMLGSMRIAEALQVLYEFLCEYNPDNPYEKISHFDPSGEYQDEDNNPCENCDESCIPYCIHECRENDGFYSCSDCCDCRTDYCYQDCDYNKEFEQFSPCDDCSESGTEYCYLECFYNEDWQLQKPCDGDCQYDECTADCPYFKKLQDLKEEITNANTE